MRPHMLLNPKITAVIQRSTSTCALIQYTRINSQRPFAAWTTEPDVRRVIAPLTRDGLARRRFATSEERKDESISVDPNHSSCSKTAVTETGAADSHSSTTSFVIPGAQTGGRKLAIVFTCNLCETRSAKQFTERSYTHGVVIVRCPGCENLHLIADRLGYFGSEDFDLQSIVEQNGDSYQTINDETVYELSLEDLVGKEKMEALLKEADDAEAKSHPNNSSS